LTEDERQAQQAELAGHIARHDVVITKPPRCPVASRPLLITEDALKAIDRGFGRGGHGAPRPLGGNVAGSVPDQTVVRGTGSTIIGAPEPGGHRAPASASAFLARKHQRPRAPPGGRRRAGH